jgi:flagella basal body P-ring formation protein FlgA
MKSLYIALIAPMFLSGSLLAQTIVSPEEVQTAVKSFVLSQLQDDLDVDARAVVAVRWRGSLTLRVEGEAQIRVRRASSRPLRGPSVLRVGIDVDGQTQRTISVTADVRIWRPVLVANHMLRRGEEIVPESYGLDERDVTKVRGNYYVDALMLQDMQAKRTLSVGDIITDKHVQKIPVIKRGDFIKLVARAGRMSMSTAGEALQDGGVGDRIRVKNSDSGKVIYGHVLDGGIIQVGI